MHLINFLELFYIINHNRRCSSTKCFQQPTQMFNHQLNVFCLKYSTNVRLCLIDKNVLDSTHRIQTLLKHTKPFVGHFIEISTKFKLKTLNIIFHICFTYFLKKKHKTKKTKKFKIT